MTKRERDDEPERRPNRSGGRRRVYAMTSGVGLAAAIGAGLLMITTTAADTRPLADPVDRSAGSPPSDDVLELEQARTEPVALTQATTSSAPPSLTPEQQKRVAAVEQVARNQEPITRALPRTPRSYPEVTVTSRRTGGQTLRVVSGRGDLTGYRELAWVADRGRREAHGTRCSQTIRLSPQEAPKRHPTLLVCWRINEQRSAYTVMVDVGQRPSAKVSVTALDAAWRRLG